MIKKIYTKLKIPKVTDTMLDSNTETIQGISYKFIIKGKGKVVSVLNQVPRREDVLGEWRYNSTHS
jgi:hypothetical protein